jgi:hypothetical protein
MTGRPSPHRETVKVPATPVQIPLVKDRAQTFFFFFFFSPHFVLPPLLPHTYLPCVKIGPAENTGLPARSIATIPGPYPAEYLNILKGKKQRVREQGTAGWSVFHHPCIPELYKTWEQPFASSLDQPRATHPFAATRCGTGTGDGARPYRMWYSAACRSCCCRIISRTCADPPEDPPG